MLLYLLSLPKVSNRKTKTPFLRCKSMVFGVQKGGFYITKVWFLFFECCVVAIRQQHYWQAVSSRRGRFIVPANPNTLTKWRTETRVRWNGYTYTIMWKCVFGEMDMCICLCQNTGAMNRPLRLAECFVVISWVFVALLTIRSQRNGRLLAAVGADLSRPHIYIRHAFAIRLKHIYVMFATCSLSVCYIFAV